MSLSELTPIKTNASPFIADVVADGPVAAPDVNAAVVGGAAVTGNVLSNDFDQDGDDLTVTTIITVAPAAGAVGTPLAGLYGSLLITSSGAYTYTPKASIGAPIGSHPFDQFTYTVSDGQGAPATTTLTITLDRPPVTAFDINTAVVGGSAAIGHVLGNDTDPDGDHLTVSAIENAANISGAIGVALAGAYGSLTIDSAGNYSYMPNASVSAPTGAHPRDVFTYTASDGHGGTATETLAITLDRPPVAAPDVSPNGGDAVVGMIFQSATGNVVSNDTDADGDSLSVIAIKNAANVSGIVNVPLAGQYGSLSINSSGSYGYTANASIDAPTGVHVTDSFTYTETDSHAGTTTSTLTVTLDRAPTLGADVNTAAVGGSAVTGNVLSNDSDPDGDTLTITGVRGNGGVPTGAAIPGLFGSLTMASNGAYTYQPNAIVTPRGGDHATHETDLFTYTEIDGQGALITQTLTITLLQPAPADFNASGKSGIAFQNADSSVAVWEMNGASIQTDGAGVLAMPGTPWSLIGSGDFYHDGSANLLLQNNQTGELAFWGVNQGAGGPQLDMSQTLQLPANLDPGATWHAIATGDFNGDGFADIAFQNDDSSVSVWEMNGASLATNGAAVLGLPGMDWHLRGAGDFYGDGTSDLLLQRDDGSLAIWGINQSANGPTLDMSETVALPANLDPGPNWVVKGTGDFNADGHSDIVFQNSQSGEVALWEMNGASLLSPTSVAVGTPGSPMTVKAVGDYNGDGMSDILLQSNQTGALVMWFMNGLSLADVSQLAANPGTSWSPVG